MTDDLTPTEVDAMLELADKATPGPYVASKTLDADDMADEQDGWWVKHDGWLDEGDGLYFSREDALFYAKSRPAFLRLARSWLAQRERINELEEALQTIVDGDYNADTTDIADGVLHD